MLRIQCQKCGELWNIIGTTNNDFNSHLKGKLLINPFSSLCYLCERHETPTKRQLRLPLWKPVKEI